MVAVVALLAPLWCPGPAERTPPAPPVTEIRLANRSGRAIDACVVVCSSDPKTTPNFHSTSRRVGPYGPEPTGMERERWGGPFVLESVTLVRGRREEPHKLNFVCKPGGRVLVEVDEKGAVTARHEDEKK
jgi:hypothetical protein